MKTFDNATAKVASRLYLTLDTPISLSCEILLRAKEWDQLATKAIDPRTYIDTSIGANRFRLDAQAVDFLRKNDSLPTSIDKERAALDSFEACEKQCFEQNYFLELIDLLPPGEPVVDEYVRILARARKLIGRVLGRMPDGLDGRFGPGTSFELKGNVTTTLADKMWVTPHVTPSAELIFRHVTDDSHWMRKRTELGLPYLAYCQGNRFTTVPKDGKTRRGICIEPLGNLQCQLGVGSFLKERMASIGIYIQREPSVGPLEALTRRRRPNGQELHRKLAEMASLTGEFATIDLSNASDTVAYGLVKKLLPDDWFTLLDSLRSPKTLVKGKWVRLEKFSSMGNGFTFELETLIFLGLIAAVTGLQAGREFWVYGDDIIIPATHYEDVAAVLKMSGFTPNMRKSFSRGPFRESCGGDFFLGMDVRSYFCTEIPDSPLVWIAMHNALRRRLPVNRKSRSLLALIVEQIPSKFQLSGPSWVGDVVLHRPRHTWRVREKDGIKWLAGVAAQSRSIPLDRWGGEFVITLALLGVPSDGIVPRGSVPTMKRCHISIS